MMTDVDHLAVDPAVRARSGANASGRAVAAVPDVLALMVGAGLVIGAVVGFVLLSAVEFDESQDLGQAVQYGAVGLIMGAALGLFVALSPTAMLVYLQRRTRATIAVSAIVAAATASTSLIVILLITTSFRTDLVAVLACAVIPAVPTAVIVGWLGRRGSHTTQASSFR